MEGGESSTQFSHRISILVVDDDTTCLSIIAACLRKWKYQVVTVKNPIDALCTLRIGNCSFDLVVSDVHMPEMNGFELQKQISQEFKLPVVLMSGDDKEGIALKGMESGAASFMMKPIAPDELKDIWQYVSLSKSNKNKAGNNGKRKSSQNENENGSENLIKKKNKVVWTHELHNHFLQAISCLGFERAVPRRIRDVMNVPGLTRVNIASHLQKYRLFLKRVKEQFECSNILSPIERSLADRNLLRSSFAMCNTKLPALIREQLREPLQLNFSSNFESTSNGTSSMQLYQPLTQATPNNTLTNTYVGTSSGLMNFRAQNEYISPSYGTSNFGSGGSNYYNYNTYGSMNNNNNSNTIDTNVFLQQVYDDADLNTIFLNQVNNESSNQQQIGEEFVDLGSPMISYNLEQISMTMNNYSAQQSSLQQLSGDYFPSFNPNPNQEQIEEGLFGFKSNSNQVSYLTSNERPDDQDFLNSIFSDVPYGEDDNNNLMTGKF